MAAASAPQLALVPQLAQLLGPAADAVATFGEMGPGIPWSNTTLEQMLEDSVYINMREQLDEDLSVNIMWIESITKRKAGDLQQIEVRISTTTTGPLIRQPFATKYFPRSVQGLRQAIELSQKQLARMRTYGFCPCYRQLAPPEKPRLRKGKTGLCTVCILKQCLQK